MPYIKMKKHEVYKLIAENPEWFQTKSGRQRYHTLAEIEILINKRLLDEYPLTFKDPGYDPPEILLYGSTLTAMVHDGVLERTRESEQDVYRYRPVLPIYEDYINDY